MLIGRYVLRTVIMRLVRPLQGVAGGMAVVAISFFGTLFILNNADSRARDSLRTEHAKLLKAALEQYRGAHGSYPATFFDNPITDLRAALVGGGFLSTIPVDPLWADTERQYRYVSAGKTYGLLVHLELANGKIAAQGACLTGVGTDGTGWWGGQPDCPFK
jgi:type II secretory pathway pseudopilin PulG